MAHDLKVPVTYALFPGADHSLARPPNGLAFCAVSETFLVGHLGGRNERTGLPFAAPASRCRPGRTLSQFLHPPKEGVAMNTLTATTKDGRRIPYLPDLIGEGGMKRVYFTGDKQAVVCFYKDHTEATDPDRMARLEAILGRYNPTKDPKTGPYFEGLFCWPTGLVVQPALGLVMPTYPAHFFFARGNWKGKEQGANWFTSPKLRKMLPPDLRGDWRNYLQLCVLLTRAVRKLHSMGLAHADLSPKCVLMDPTGENLAIVDVDAVVVPGLFPPDVLGTPGYIAPEILMTQDLPFDDPRRKLPTGLTDLHALAVMIYVFLLSRHPLRGPRINSQSAEVDEILSMGEKALFIEDPHDRSNRPAGITVTCDQLGPHLSQLFHQAFVDGLHHPPARPSADQWETALCRSQDLLIPCGNQACEDRWFVYRPSEACVCPRCRWKLDTPTPVLEFFDPRDNGQSRPDGDCLVAWHQRTLHQWHVCGDGKPVAGVEPEEQARVVFHQGRWLLVNKELDSLVSPGGTPVLKGQAFVLRNGAEVLLSKEEHGRRVRVTMIS